MTEELPVGIGLGACVAAIRTLDVVGDIRRNTSAFTASNIYQNGNSVLDK